MVDWSIEGDQGFELTTWPLSVILVLIRFPYKLLMSQFKNIKKSAGSE